MQKPKPTKREIEMNNTPDLRVRLNPKALSWDLFLFEEVTGTKISELIQHMLALDETNINATINLLICSPGGHCGAGYALIDVMSSLKHKVRTIAFGEVASMGSLIFIAGTPGLRIMGPRTIMLFHPISDAIADYGPYIKDRVKSLDQSDGFCQELMKERTGLPANLIDKANNGELWLDAGEAIKYRVADGIISDTATIAKMYSTIQKKGKK